MPKTISQWRKNDMGIRHLLPSLQATPLWNIRRLSAIHFKWLQTSFEIFQTFCFEYILNYIVTKNTTKYSSLLIVLLVLQVTTVRPLIRSWLLLTSSFHQLIGRPFDWQSINVLMQRQVSSEWFYVIILQIRELEHLEQTRQDGPIWTLVIVQH